MVKLTILLLLLTVCFFNVHAASDVNSQIGVIDTNQNNEVCLAIQNADLKKGDKVFIIMPEKPQSVKMAVVVEKLASSCSRNTETGENDSFYSLNLAKGKFNELFVGFGVTNSKSNTAAVKGIVSTDLNNDQKKEYFRVCTSSEGLHLTVWTGKPLIGKRIWHTYYYLGYDVEPNCKKADYKE